MRQLLKYFIFAALLILISAFDTALVPAFGGVFVRVNLALMISLFLVVIVNEKIALTVYLLSSLITILTSASLHISPILIGGGTLIMVNWLIASFFTNRSYYTLIALGLIGWFSYYGLFSFVTFLLGIFNEDAFITSINASWAWDVIISGAIAVILWSAGYILTKFMSVRFKSYFIIHH